MLTGRHAVALNSLVFVGGLAKLRKATISCVMSVCLSVLPPVGQHGTTRFQLEGFFTKFDTSIFFENLSRKFKLYSNLTRRLSWRHEGVLCEYIIYIYIYIERERERERDSFFTSPLHRDERSTSRSGDFTPRKDHRFHWKGGYVRPRGSLDILEKRFFFFLFCGLRTPDSSTIV